MKRIATQSETDTTGNGSSTIKHGAQFIGVRDSRNRRVPGLYQRNGRFYAQFWVSREGSASTPTPSPLAGTIQCAARGGAGGM